jgi:hypothetical protein
VIALRKNQVDEITGVGEDDGRRLDYVSGFSTITM